MMEPQIDQSPATTEPSHEALPLLEPQFPQTELAENQVTGVQQNQEQPPQQQAWQEGGLGQGQEKTQEEAGGQEQEQEQDPAVTIKKLLKGKHREWDSVSKRTGKLTLLELPLDILRLIVAEVTHTNDLSALALTNSTLHNLAVPHIYSRFDIVWPDASQLSQSDSKNVDALTYGLSTLCLGNSFASQAKKLFVPRPSPRATTRLKNDHATYIKKFSLGNGPDDWVAEYMVTKESGKMLGTLVALAVAKMTNLEAFVWDMPTGVLADIFMALSSIQDRREDNQSRLDRVWVRWHDNSEGSPSSPTTAPAMPADATSAVPNGSTMTSIGVLVPSTTPHPRPRGTIPFSESRVEFPTFSVLPPLKSLTVLDIDELAYLDEMATLIEASQGKLEELRVGIAPKAMNKAFVQTWDGPGLQQVDHRARWPGESTIGERRLGGILGVLLGKVYDIRKKTVSKADDKNTPTPVEEVAGVVARPSAGINQDQSIEAAASSHVAAPASVDTQTTIDSDQTAVTTPSPGQVSHPHGESNADAIETTTSSANITQQKTDNNKDLVSDRKRLEGKIKLKSLELERVPLSVHVCTKAIDWSVLTTLTILECAQHENLWKALRKQFQPSSVFGAGHSSSKHSSGSQLRYHLSLKNIHTDRASPSLISFLRDTLAPNSLEVLLLQDRRPSIPPPVTIQQIFKGPIKRHCASLRKLLLDSSDSKSPNSTLPETYRWLSWTITTDMLLYMTSGRMKNLRELSISLQHKDWHTFLQRLPNVPHLRSLHLSKIADHVATIEPKELALQIVDIITLKPEIQLCYVGIAKKCFEILETKPWDAPSDNDGPGHGDDGIIHHSGVDDDDDVSDDDDDDDDDASVDTSEDEGEGQGMVIVPAPGEGHDAIPPHAPAGASDDSQSDDDDASADDGDVSDSDSFHDDTFNGMRLRLREILFYDDRVAIFKARHGRL